MLRLRRSTSAALNLLTVYILLSIFHIYIIIITAKEQSVLVHFEVFRSVFKHLTGKVVFRPDHRRSHLANKKMKFNT